MHSRAIKQRIGGLLVLTISLPSASADMIEGIATVYGSNSFQNGACGLRKAPDGVDPNLFVAMNSPNYGGSCGRCVKVQGPAATVVTYAADLCRECPKEHLDLNTPLWEKAMGHDHGKQPIKWKFVPCPNPEPHICVKEGSNPYWLALQAANTKDGVKSMKINNSPTQYVSDNAFFQAAGLTGPLDLSNVEIEMTSNSGEVTNHKLALPGIDCYPIKGGSSSGNYSNNNNNNNGNGPSNKNNQNTGQGNAPVHAADGGSSSSPTPTVSPTPAPKTEDNNMNNSQTPVSNNKQDEIKNTGTPTAPVNDDNQTPKPSNTKRARNRRRYRRHPRSNTPGTSAPQPSISKSSY